ncbi:MAG: sigma-70 family RNA polymerase sigma factor [Armatimonadota bacterium]|nr:sigma-70 family RNA polymerase sigma factor [Armatimonadota bacterium]
MKSGGAGVGVVIALDETPWSHPASGCLDLRRLAGAARPDESDTAIIARCQEGSREAFEILLHRYRKRILNLAYSLLHSREDAEDAAQEAFMKAFTAIHTFRSESQFWTWLYRITLNICLHRKRRARTCESLDDAERNDRLEQDDVQQQAEAKLMVESALNELSPPLRVVLILREMHDLSYEDIARILDLPVGTVRSRLFEARRKFKLAWREEDTPEENS